MNESPRMPDDAPFERSRTLILILGIILVCGAICALLWFGLGNLPFSPNPTSTSAPTVTATFEPTSTSTATLTPKPTLTFTPRPTLTATADQRVLNPANQHLYLYVKEKMSWHGARDACASRGGHLVTIQDRSENKFVFELATNHLSFGTWLGATDEAQEGTWVWASGEPWKYTNWRAGEPNNNGDGEPEHFLTFTKDPPGDGFRTWNDTPDGEQYFICEWEP